MADERLVEWLKCSKSFAYFVDKYIYIYDAIQGVWVPFSLWPMQRPVANDIATKRLILVLKARQLGISWLGLAYLLWLMIFKAAATVMLFSRRETEAGYLMRRLREMYKRLPDHMKAEQIQTNNTLTMVLSNGSSAYGFPTTAGDSYTATAVLVDEADLIPDLDALMRAVKPTIDAGGRMIMVSRSNKDDPMSPFKNLYRAALEGRNDWHPIFLPWWTRPERTEEWYQEIVRDVMTRTGSMDEVWEQYPATTDEALKAVELDKRFNPDFLEAVYEPMQPVSKGDLPGLVVYKRPVFGRRYQIGADPAEGNPKSDDSVAIVLDVASGEEMAALAGKIEPTIFASYLEDLSKMFNDARIRPERNNHGHVVIGLLAPELVLKGLDGKPGWHTNIKSKAHMYSHAVKVVSGKLCIIHSKEAQEQLLSIEGATLRAPKEMPDDWAVAFALASLGVQVNEAASFVLSQRHLAIQNVKKDPRLERLGLL